MTAPHLSRRSTLAALAATCALGAIPIRAEASPAIRVLRDPDCGCCGAWVEILEADGFMASVELLDPAALQAHKEEMGLPAALTSCHTAHVEGYVIEGHVPPADIRRLLAQRPDALGLAVPGMPIGSPGMGPESAREAYEVLLIRRDGRTEVFAAYDAA